MLFNTEDGRYAAQRQKDEDLHETASMGRKTIEPMHPL